MIIIYGKKKKANVPRKNYVLKIYKHGKLVTTVKSVNDDYIIRKLREQ